MHAAGVAEKSTSAPGTRRRRRTGPAGKARRLRRASDAANDLLGPAGRAVGRHVRSVVGGECRRIGRAAAVDGANAGVLCNDDARPSSVRARARVKGPRPERGRAEIGQRAERAIGRAFVAGAYERPPGKTVDAVHVDGPETGAGKAGGHCARRRRGGRGGGLADAAHVLSATRPSKYDDRKRSETTHVPPPTFDVPASPSRNTRIDHSYAIARRASRTVGGERSVESDCRAARGVFDRTAQSERRRGDPCKRAA